MDESHSISSLLPDLFKIPRPNVIGSNPLIVSANILELDEVQMLPIVRGSEPKINSTTGIKMFAAFGGFSVSNAIKQTNPKDYLKLLWTPCQVHAVWIGSVKYTDSLEDLLKVLYATNFGNAVVEDSGGNITLVTLNDILTLYKSNTMKSSIIVSEVGTEMVMMSPESSLIDAIRMMVQKRIRRVFLRTEKENLLFQFVTASDIIRFLFSPSILEVAKQNPVSWLDAKLSEIRLCNAKAISAGKTVNQAAREIGNGIDDCLVSDLGKVVTRWDIVVKPWMAKNYSWK